MQIIEEYLPHVELLNTENFTLQEINQINNKLKAIKLYSCSELWEYKALIAADWQFFEDNWHVVNADGEGIIHYVLLNGNTLFIQQALEKSGVIAFQAVESLENLLRSCIKARKPFVLEWIEQHYLTTLQALRENQAISLLHTAWRYDCLPVVDFCHKHFKQYLHNMEKDQFNLIRAKDPEAMVYFYLIKNKGWDKAFTIRQTAWKHYLQKKLSIKEAVHITQAMWKHGTKDSLQFCYTHFQEQLYTEGRDGKIKPRLDEEALKKIVMENQNDKALIEEAFFKSGAPDKVICNTLWEATVVSNLLEEYLLLRECVYTREISSFLKRYQGMPDTLQNLLFFKIEKTIERNQAIHTLYPVFQKIVCCHMLLKEAFLPEIALEISLCMLDSYKIRPLFTFFNSYEKQMLRVEQNTPDHAKYSCGV